MTAPPTNHRRRSLRRSLQLIVMTATVAALVLSAAGLLAYELYNSRDNWLTDLRSQTDLMSQSIEATLVFDDRKAAQETLAAFRLRPQIKTALVVDQAGRPFARYRSEDSDGADAQLAPAAEGDHIDWRFVAVGRAIRHGGERVGTLYVVARHDVLGRAVNYLWILVLATATGAIVAALVFRRMHPAITAPIVSMAETSRRIIEDRNYDVRVQARHSDDEIGTLVVAFNSMLDTLRTEIEERRGAEEALRAADARKDEFLATLAHELRNPLAPISTGLALLKRADGDPALRARMQDMMSRQLKQLVRLIDDLLEVSRITRGKLELRREVVEVGDLAREAVESAEPSLQAKGQTLRTHYPPAPVWIDADRARIIQALVNLLGNAGKYTPSQGRIELWVEASAGAVQLRVVDDGIGIDPAQLDQVFGLFYQVDKSMERGVAGLGIGLTIARQLVQMHGGTLRASSAGTGQGSTFTIGLPTVAAPTLPAPRADDGVRAAAGVDVVIADDNVDFADSFAAVLRLAGHVVRVAYEGGAALALIRQRCPRVAFLDLGMPVINGLELAARLRDLDHAGPLTLVAVTGWGQKADQQRAREAGFDQHLTKPIDAAATERVFRSLDDQPAGVRAGSALSGMRR